MDRKARIVRFYLLLAAMLLLGLWEPAWWFGLMPIAFFQGGCPCCGITCTCCDPTSTSATFQVDIGGFTNDTCTVCASYNGSFLVINPGPIYNGGTLWTCAWDVLLTGSLCSCGFSASCDTVYFSLNRTGDVDLQVGIVSQAAIATNVALWRELSISPDPDCSGFSSRVVTLVSESMPCLHDGSNATLTAL